MSLTFNIIVGFYFLAFIFNNVTFDLSAMEPTHSVRPR